MENSFLLLPSDCASCKIREQTQACGLALFRMKLHTADIFMGDY
jgi:hypothetical protein